MSPFFFQGSYVKVSRIEGSSPFLPSSNVARFVNSKARNVIKITIATRQAINPVLVHRRKN
jgi:hypothetical protein